MSMLLSAALLHAVTGNMHDVIDAVDAFVAPPECPNGCMNWTAALNVSEQAASFTDPSLLPSLGAHCAIPGQALHAGQRNGNGQLSAMEKAAFYGPICPCLTSNAASSAVEYHTCTAPFFVPEQINLQLANSSTVVVSFVSHEKLPPTAEPMARLGLASAGPPTATMSGVSHWFETSHVNGTAECNSPYDTWNSTSNYRKCSVRNITMHFIRFPSLEPRQKYTYQVRSGGGDDAWSQLYTFRAPYGHGTAAKTGGSNATRVAIYGDMGNTAGNNMGNLRAGCASGTIDAVVHMGDHAYNMGSGNDYHGDAYMQAFQGTLAQCPWLPVIGNHESTLGSEHDIDASTEERYLNQTWGVIFGQDGVESETSTARSTATTSLGHLLTRSSFYGGGSHGAAPSRTSQWYSIDLGLIHFVVLDLNVGPPAVFSGAQVAWAAADLAAADANRANVPWVVVTSHYPLYTASFYEASFERASAAWYTGEVAESERKGDGTPWSATPHFEECDKKGKRNESENVTCTTAKEVVEESISTLGALLDKYHVDIYASGHEHQYSVTWPIFGGALTEQSFANPKGTVHVVEGNGGVPGAHEHTKLFPCKKAGAGSAPLNVFRKCGLGMNYGRLVTMNASVLTYEHVANSDDRVYDSWSIIKTPCHRRDKKKCDTNGK
jgi:hypothetical protein